MMGSVISIHLDGARHRAVEAPAVGRRRDYPQRPPAQLGARVHLAGVARLRRGHHPNGPGADAGRGVAADGCHQ